MLARFLKPNWQHPKPDKRVKAVARLRPTDAKAQPILSQLALEDQDELVRLNATEKLLNLNLLIKISKQDPSANIQQQALHRISQILLNQEIDTSAEEKQNALASLKESNFLTHIALNSRDASLREQAIRQLNDNANLAVIAEKSQRASVRLLAAEKIDCPETLERLSKLARNKDKGVYKIVRDKLQDLRKQEKLQAELQERIEKLISATADLSRSEFFPLYGAKLNALENEWVPLETQASREQQQRFNQFQVCCQQQIAERQAEEQAKQQQIAREQALREQAHTLYTELCALKESAGTAPDELSQVDQLEAELTALEQQWQEMEAFSTGADQNSFTRVRNQLLTLLNSFRLFFEQQQAVIRQTDALSNPELSGDQARNMASKAEKLINRINWPRQISKPDTLSRLENALSRLQQQVDQQQSQTRKLQQELDQELNSLKQAISAGEIRSADKQIKRAEQLSKRLNGKLPAELDQRIKSLGAELQEIRDWQAYAVTPKKEALCEAMEALADSTLDVAELATQIKRIQKEWKLLDATDSVHSQQLWKRFKNASDQAYAPCDAHFAEQRDLRRHNLQQRELICTKLSQLAPLNEDEPNPDVWKAYEEQLRQAKLNWKEHTPVDRAPGKKLQAQFDQLLRALEHPLKAQQKQNATAKQALISQVQELLCASDLQQATEQVKQLQQDWKLLGSAPRNQERKLWQQFRELCNQVFERYYDRRAGHADQTGKLNERCNELEQLCNSNSPLSLLQQKLAQAQQLSDEIDNNSPLLQRLNRIATRISQQQTVLARFESEPFQRQQRKAVICNRLENAILNDQIDTELEQIRNDWNQEGEDTGSEVDQRYQTLMQLIEAPEQIHALLEQQELRLRQLCIRLEIAASLPSPVEDQALRMEYQMERLQQALAEQNQSCNLAEIRELEFEWLGVPFADQFEHLQERFQQQLQNLI
ncbi:DUF349 domain-containing protein [Neptuniibacter halophilus]|uniref:DUF349 domain-containing protein n=1 Tax=Neptuniibacter halophilus TaxID=651666 RepID=UPI0025724430|nr:DUF349 domain-containing protein [Neptuniibacter halophilus]